MATDCVCGFFFQKWVLPRIFLKLRQWTMRWYRARPAITITSSSPAPYPPAETGPSHSLREPKKDRPLRVKWGSSADRRDMALSSQIMRRIPSLFTSQTSRVSMCPSQGTRWPTRSFWFLLRWRRGRLYMSKSPTWHPVSPTRNGTPPLIWKLTRCIPVWESEPSSTEW